MKDGVVWIKVLTPDKKKLIAEAEIFTGELVKKTLQSNMDNGDDYEKIYGNINPSKSYLNDLVVRKEFQGQGIGSQIIEAIIKKYNISYLDVFKEGKVAKRVYEKFGFKVYRENEEIYFMRR